MGCARPEWKPAQSDREAGTSRRTLMGKVVVFTSVSLDGVMQAPGRPDEDTRGGFAQGGWGITYADAVAGEAAGERMQDTAGILLGRRTYEDFYSFWPKQKDNPYTDALNGTQKYVASRTLEEPLAWLNSSLLRGDVPEAVKELKRKESGHLVVLGSGELVRSLMRAGLVDEYFLLIHPLILGGGRRLFDDGVPLARLQLADTTTTTTGVVMARYMTA